MTENNQSNWIISPLPAASNRRKQGCNPGINPKKGWCMVARELLYEKKGIRYPPFIPRWLAEKVYAIPIPCISAHTWTDWTSWTGALLRYLWRISFDRVPSSAALHAASLGTKTGIHVFPRIMRGLDPPHWWIELCHNQHGTADW